MAWELVAIWILAALLGMHVVFDRMHSGRMKRFGAYMDEIDRLDVPDEMYEESLNCTRMHAWAKADRRSNLHAITVHVVCLTGLVIMHLLNWADLVDAMGWTSLLVVSLPAYLSVDHLRTAVLPPRLKHRPLTDEH